MEEFALAAVYGVGLGFVAAGALSVTGPLSRGDERTWEAVALLGALCLLCIGGGAFVLDGREAIFIAIVAAVVGGGVFWILGRSPSEDAAIDVTQPLSTAEMRRAKTQEDTWVLVTGSQASGKTALVKRLIAEARRFGPIRLASPARTGEDVGVRVTELRLSGPGREATLRFWERAWGEGSPSQPALRDLDGVVVTIDPTSVIGTARTFPSEMKAGPAVVDVNAEAIALDASLAKAGQRAVVWQVITKTDLIRFSIEKALVKLVKAGTGWHEQLREFDIPRRRDLAACLGVDTSDRRAMPQGQGSPFLAYSGRGTLGNGAFGADPLFRAIVDTLVPEARWERGGSRAP